MSRFPLLFLLLASAAQAGWKTHVFPDDSDSMPDRASIANATVPQFGLPTLQDAIRCGVEIVDRDSCHGYLRGRRY